MRKLLETKHESNQKEKHLGCTPCKILGFILEMNERRSSTNGPKDRKLMMMNKALYPTDDIDCMCQEKKEEEDLPALKTVLMHQCEDLKTT